MLIQKLFPHYKSIIFLRMSEDRPKHAENEIVIKYKGTVTGL
jgi:hypothetical protein